MQTSLKTQPRQAKGAKVAGRSAGGEFAPRTRTAGSDPFKKSPSHGLDRKFDTLEEKIAAMSEEVETLVENLKTDEGWNNYLAVMSKFHRYSFTNQLLIGVQLPDATRVGGAGMWKSLGRTLKPFEERGNGASIFRPIIASVEKLDENGDPVIGPDGKALRERRPVGYSATTVYDISQTEGPDLPGDIPEYSQEPPPGFVSDLESSIADLGYEVTYEEISGSASGYTSPQKRKVAIDSRLPEGQRARVLAHELGHIAAGHTEQTDDYHTSDGGQRGRMEIEADSISHVLLRMNGMDPSEHTGRYSAGWARAQSDDPDVVKNAAAAVQLAVKQLVGSKKWANIPDSGPKDPQAAPRRRKARKK